MTNVMICQFLCAVIWCIVGSDIFLFSCFVLVEIMQQSVFSVILH